MKHITDASQMNKDTVYTFLGKHIDFIFYIKREFVNGFTCRNVSENNNFYLNRTAISEEKFYYEDYQGLKYVIYKKGTKEDYPEYFL